MQKSSTLNVVLGSAVVVGMIFIYEALREGKIPPLTLLLLQIVVIVSAAKAFGYLIQKVGQPAVVGEMVAGVLLGPMFFGSWFPEVSGLFFPEASLSHIQYLSQLGLVLFMFTIGLDMDLNGLKKSSYQAVFISHASIVLPFALGVFLSFYLFEQFAPAGVSFLSFSLFMGVAMSITAFPVLARIVKERGLSQTFLGKMAITCAAVDDVTAWCILAGVVAVARAGSSLSVVYILLGTLVYVFLMFKVVRPFLEEKCKNQGSLPLTLVFLLLLVSALVAELIGIHALFGAFLAGIILPEKSSLRKTLMQKVEDLTVILLLPLFFAYSGLRLSLESEGWGMLWVPCVFIILAAVSGKFLGSSLAAKFSGLDWRTSLSLGTLMNTRGLMELVVLNIGLDLGVISHDIYAMMFFMAIFTTFMTGPVLKAIYRNN
jgi:Kef-type K+ transport system membrane component KefB